MDRPERRYELYVYRWDYMLCEYVLEDVIKDYKPDALRYDSDDSEDGDKDGFLCV